MPNCFQLISKETGQPTPFSKIDDDICAHFDVEPDPVRYLCGWYDAIGWRVATGKTLDECLAEFTTRYDEAPVTDECNTKVYYGHMIEITEWLIERFTTNAWVEIGRR